MPDKDSQPELVLLEEDEEPERQSFTTSLMDEKGIDPKARIIYVRNSYKRNVDRLKHTAVWRLANITGWPLDEVLKVWESHD